MRYYLADSFRKNARALCRRNPQLLLILRKQFTLFQDNSMHPSLKFHKLRGKRSDQYSLRITADIRAISFKDKNGAHVFFDIVTHDQY